MSNSTQQTVDFLGKDLALVHDEYGTTYVPLKRVCEILEIDHKKARRKIKGSGLFPGKTMPVRQVNGHTYRMFCLHFDDLRPLVSIIIQDLLRPDILEEAIDFFDSRVSNNCPDFIDFQKKDEDWEERYWKERIEEGRDLPQLPNNSDHLVDLLSEEIQESLKQIRDTIHDYEQYAIYKEVYASKSPIDLSILAHLRDDLKKLADNMTEEFHIMLSGNDYWRWSCCNEPKVAEELGREMESLAQRGRSTN